MTDSSGDGKCDFVGTPVDSENIKLNNSQQLSNTPHISPIPEVKITEEQQKQTKRAIYNNRVVGAQDEDITIPKSGLKNTNLQTSGASDILSQKELNNELHPPQPQETFTNNQGGGSQASGGTSPTSSGSNSGSNSQTFTGGGAALKSPAPQLGKSDGADISKKKSCVEGLPSRSIFPFNKVLQTECGHVAEMDDSPGGERIHVCHRTGTNVEFLPAGSLSFTVVRDLWASVYRDAHLHIDGYTDLTIDKALRVVVNKDQLVSTKEKAANFDLYVGGTSNVNLYVEGGNVNITMKNGDVNMRLHDGDINIRQDSGNYNHFVNGNYNLEVAGNMHTIVGGSVLHEIGGGRETIINGAGDSLRMTKSDAYVEINCYLYELIASNKSEQLYGSSLLSIGNDYKISVFGDHNLEVLGTVNRTSSVENVLTQFDYRLTIGRIGHFYTSYWNRGESGLKRPLEDKLCPEVVHSLNPDLYFIEHHQGFCTPSGSIFIPKITSADILKRGFITNDEMFSDNKINIANRDRLPQRLVNSWSSTSSRKRDN